MGLLSCTLASPQQFEKKPAGTHIRVTILSHARPSFILSLSFLRWVNYRYILLKLGSPITWKGKPFRGLGTVAPPRIRVRFVSGNSKRISNYHQKTNNTTEMNETACFYFVFMISHSELLYAAVKNVVFSWPLNLFHLVVTKTFKFIAANVCVSTKTFSSLNISQTALSYAYKVFEHTQSQSSFTRWCNARLNARSCSAPLRTFSFITSHCRTR